MNSPLEELNRLPGKSAGLSFKGRREFWFGTVARWSASHLLWLDCLILVGDGPCLHSSLVRCPTGSIPVPLNDGAMGAAILNRAGIPAGHHQRAAVIHDQPV